MRRWRPRQLAPEVVEAALFVTLGAVAVLVGEVVVAVLAAPVFPVAVAGSVVAGFEVAREDFSTETTAVEVCAPGSSLAMAAPTATQPSPDAQAIAAVMRRTRRVADARSGSRTVVLLPDRSTMTSEIQGVPSQSRRVPWRRLGRQLIAR